MLKGANHIIFTDEADFESCCSYSFGEYMLDGEFIDRPTSFPAAFYVPTEDFWIGDYYVAEPVTEAARKAKRALDREISELSAERDRISLLTGKQVPPSSPNSSSERRQTDR